MNNFIAKHLLYYPSQYFRGQKVWKFIPEVWADERRPEEEIQRLRDEKIRKLVGYAYENIPYYRKMMLDKGIRPETINGYDDLTMMPILTKEAILKNSQSLIKLHSSKRMYERKTGGSTGMILHFFKEADALAKNDAIMYRCYAWYGIDIGDRQARFWGVPVKFKTRVKESIKDVLLNRIRISAFDISESTCMGEYKRMRRFRPTHFYGYTTAIYGFCRMAKELGLNLKELRMKAVICTAEKMYPHHRELLSEMFDCPIVDEYGSSENGIIAFQCRQGNMHLMSDHLAIEFVDEQGQRVKPGELGRIVITDLSSFEMPQIRYDIGDIGRLSDKKCSCGITLPLMDIVEGRKEDFIRTKEGKLVHAAYLCYTLKEDTIHEFKMIQKDIDRFHVQLVRSPLFNSESEKKLERNLRSALGNDAQISFEYLDRISREKSGKLRYFISELSEPTDMTSEEKLVSGRR